MEAEMNSEMAYCFVLQLQTLSGKVQGPFQLLTFFCIIGTGKAIINTPVIQPTLPISLPITVCGTMSPYLK